MDWQPIETLDVADHERFDGWFVGGWRQERAADCWRADGRIWAYDEYGDRWDVTIGITHWMPVPAPPK